MKDDQRVTLTKRLLKDGLLRLMQKQNLDKISVTQLCSESGINRATFYRHYEQPKDILNELRYEMSANVKAIVSKQENIDNIQKSIEDVCSYFYDNAELLKIFFETRTDDDFVMLINEIYADQFAEIRQRELLNEIDDDSLRIGAFYYAGGFFFVLRQWILEPINKTPKEIAEVIYGLINQGSRVKGYL